jgi:HEAT repeat protein
LRGDKSARLDALRWLSVHDPAPGEPLRAEIGKALETLLVAQPGEANLAAHALARWATLHNLPAVAAATWYEHPPGVSGVMKNALQRLRDAEGAEGRKAIDEAVERGRDAARLDAIRIALAEAKSDDDGTRLRAVRRLRKMPVEPQFQDEVISTMSELIRDHKSTSRTDAVGTIGAWARPGDEKILVEVLEDKEDRLFARPTALEALARSKDPEFIARIVAVAPDRAVSSQAAKAIRDYGTLAEPALLDLLHSDSAQARMTACRLLDNVGTGRCLPALKEAAKDPDRNVAATARTVVIAVERRLGVESGTVEKAQTVEKSPRKKSSRPVRKRMQPKAPNDGDN